MTTVQRLPDYPGIAPRTAYEAGEADYFEHAYDIGDGYVMRARFVPGMDPTDISADLNTPGAPRDLLVRISRSLVDEQGQVLRVAGRALVRDQTAHKYVVTGPQPIDLEAWLDEMAGFYAAELKSVHAQFSAAALLIPPLPAPAPAAEPVDDGSAA